MVVVMMVLRSQPPFPEPLHLIRGGGRVENKAAVLGAKLKRTRDALVRASEEEG